VQQQLENLHSLWDLRRTVHSTGYRAATVRESVLKRRNIQIGTATIPSGPTVEEWELSLGRMVIGRTPSTPLEKSIAEDPGVPLVTELIHEFRASMVVAVYRLTSRLLMLALTPDLFRAILQDYWSKFPPRQYAGSEADGFFSFLTSKNLRVPWFQKILEFERAAVLTLCDGQPRVVRFSADPLPVLRALAEGRLPDVIPQEGDYEIELTPDGPITVSGIDLNEVALTFPFH